MVAEQEEEEGGLQWRIDAEVRLALQEAQAGEAARLAELQVGTSASISGRIRPMRPKRNKPNLHAAVLSAIHKAKSDCQKPVFKIFSRSTCGAAGRLPSMAE